MFGSVRRSAGRGSYGIATSVGDFCLLGAPNSQHEVIQLFNVASHAFAIAAEDGVSERFSG